MLNYLQLGDPQMLINCLDHAKTIRAETIFYNNQLLSAQLSLHDFAFRKVFRRIHNDCVYEFYR